MVKQRHGISFSSKEVLSLFKQQIGDLPIEAVKSARVAEVHFRWKRAVQQVYKESANLVLDHTNAVYIMRPSDTDDKAADKVSPGHTLLIVYLDDAMIRSDIDARQEFLKVRLNEQGEHVEVFSIKASRQGMKSRHPFKNEGAADETSSAATKKEVKKTLTPTQSEGLIQQTKEIQNSALRDALTKAIKANTQP